MQENEKDYLVLTRHKILLVLIVMKFILIIILSVVFGIIAFQFRTIVPSHFVIYVVFPIIFLVFNYAFLQVILNLIRFYNRIIIIEPEKLTILHSSLFLMDDMEVMDMGSILKVDVEQHGLISNILQYGHLILEQRNEIRRIHYIAEPYKVINVLRKHLRFKNDKTT